MRVAIIPARGGSRRIPKKNIRKFHGRPILAYSIEAALKSELFSSGCVWVSTEDEHIGRMAEGYGARWWKRDANLAEDAVGTQDVARDVIEWLHANDEPFRHACCIYATAPLMTADDLRRGYVDFVTSGMAYALVEGWFYWGYATAFGRAPIDVTTAVRGDVGERWIDINTEEDWKTAEVMYLAQHPELRDLTVRIS